MSLCTGALVRVGPLRLRGGLHAATIQSWYVLGGQTIVIVALVGSGFYDAGTLLEVAAEQVHPWGRGSLNG